MAITARISSGTTVGGVAIRQSTRSSVVSQRFDPKPNVSLSEVSGVSTTGVQDGFTLIFNSETGLFEAQSPSDLTGTITEITGGTF